MSDCLLEQTTQASMIEFSPPAFQKLAKDDGQPHGDNLVRMSKRIASNMFAELHNLRSLVGPGAIRTSKSGALNELTPAFFGVHRNEGQDIRKVRDRHFAQTER